AFADNWPNRARWWFPSNDHPADKATVRFDVTAPVGWAVVANGRLSEVVPLRTRANRTRWVWETDPDAPIPPYAMVIGLARFERSSIGAAACGMAPAVAPEGGYAAVEVWALAGDGAYGTERFSRAADMLDFYTELIGPYPYEKLAHVESSTRFGGMENSSAIFYARAGWEGRRMGEGVIAHETAHQWFGDSVTPASWYHLWVSEGFASYFGPLYFEARDGVERFRELMASSRETATTSDVVGQAILDSTSNQLFDLLNRNNYQKGAWVLHMLRARLGDDVFFRAIRDYYERHEHGVADTDDVRAAFERASGDDLAAYFDQWVARPGHPRLAITWRPVSDDLVLTIAQTQPSDWPTFALDFEIEIRGGARDGERESISISDRESAVTIVGAGSATGIAFDPDVEVLATAEVRRGP
ncbi:MAG: M1 family metallopeptidase, partial [Gemmatimonadetes bacterium]|nr:M1 family metallopeptidase [Gemmatimonadota bacterium]